MEKGKLLSIIIPAYNVEDYIEQCLNSIFDGMSEEAAELTEVIVVNDGSTDQTGEILKNYKQNGYSLIVVDKINGGVSSARNTGINIANGKYIYFVDGDDYIANNALHKVLLFLSSNDSDIVEFDGCILENGVIRSGIRDRKAVGKSGSGQDVWTWEEKRSCFENVVWLRCIARDIIIQNAVYFYEGAESEDEEWLPRVFSYARSVAYLDDYIYIYRIRDGSLTRIAETNKSFADLIKVSDSLVKFSQSSHLSDEFRKTLLGVISYIYWRSFRGIKLGGVWDEELIADIEKRFYIMDYSTKFHRKYIYRPFIRVFGLKAYYALKYAHKGS